MPFFRSFFSPGALRKWLPTNQSRDTHNALHRGLLGKQVGWLVGWSGIHSTIYHKTHFFAVFFSSPLPFYFEAMR